MVEKFMSLYDYLGHAAGPSLGKEVFEIAFKQKEPIIHKIIKTNTYSGKINMYRVSFLNSIFVKKIKYNYETR